MAWRLARSLQVLEAEVQQVAPGTTVWDIGGEDHQDEPSDHNPNAEGVVCAIDVLGDAGLDLAWFAEQVRTSGHIALKYVVYNRRIASARSNPPWSWRTYTGSNPHTGHVHVSVGEGPDGQSTGPYDNTSEWGVDTMPTAEQIADAILYRRHRDYLTGESSTVSHQLYSARRDAARPAPEVLARLAAIEAHLAGDDVAEAAAAAVRAEFAALGPALAAELRELPAERVEAALRAVLGSLDEPAGG